MEPEQEYEVYAGNPQPHSVRRFVCHEVASDGCPGCGAPLKAGAAKYFVCGSWLQLSGHLRRSDTCLAGGLEADVKTLVGVLRSVYSFCTMPECARDMVESTLQKYKDW